MIEVTTGAVFLMSSLYGSGQPAAATMAVQSQPVVQEAETPASFTDSKQVEAYVRKQYADQPILIDIAFCESTFRQYDKNGSVMRGKVNNADVGVMQINEKYHSDEAVRLGLDLHTVEGNVAYAKVLYKKFGSQPWISSSPCWSNMNDLAKK